MRMLAGLTVTCLLGVLVTLPLTIGGCPDIQLPGINIGQGNAPPVANAGPNRSGVEVGETVELSGSGSQDPDGDSLSFAWVRTAGPSVPLRNANQETATFVPTQAGSYRFTLTVSDGKASDSDTVTIDVADETGEPNEPNTPENDAPTANAGEDQTVDAGGEVTLDGSGSADPDDDELDYAWTQTGGPPVDLVDADEEQATFVPTEPGVYSFKLTVSDGEYDDDDSVKVTVEEVTIENQDPVADAGEDQEVALGEEAVLDGSASFDPDDDELAFDWVLVDGPADVELVDADTDMPTFVADEPGDYEFELAVDDHLGGVSTDTVVVTVTEGEGNNAPEADAGEDQEAALGDEVTLDGSASFDPDGDELVFDWVQLDGPIAVELVDADTDLPSFIADEAGDYVFALTVADPFGEWATATVIVTVVGESVEEWIVGRDFHVGLDKVVSVGDSVPLMAEADEAPTLDYTNLWQSWTQIDGPATMMYDWGFRPSEPGDYLFEVIVEDDLGRTGTAQMAVTVLDDYSPVPDGDTLDHDYVPDVTDPVQGEWNGEGSFTRVLTDAEGVADTSTEDASPWLIVDGNALTILLYEQEATFAAIGDTVDRGWDDEDGHVTWQIEALDIAVGYNYAYLLLGEYYWSSSSGYAEHRTLAFYLEVADDGSAVYVDRQVWDGYNDDGAINWGLSETDAAMNVNRQLLGSWTGSGERVMTIEWDSGETTDYGPDPVNFDLIIDESSITYVIDGETYVYDSIGADVVVYQDDGSITTYTVQDMYISAEYGFATLTLAYTNELPSGLSEVGVSDVTIQATGSGHLMYVEDSNSDIYYFGSYYGVSAGEVNATFGPLEAP